MSTKLSPFQAFWIGIRAENKGKGTKILKKYGFWTEKHGRLNNRNGCDFIYPCGKRNLKDFNELFNKLEISGFKGIAFSWTDVQWKYNKGLTDLQWQNRVQIG